MEDDEYLEDDEPQPQVIPGQISELSTEPVQGEQQTEDSAVPAVEAEVEPYPPLLTVKEEPPTEDYSNARDPCDKPMEVAEEKKAQQSVSQPMEQEPESSEASLPYLPSTPAQRDDESPPSSKRSTGRQRNARARKCISKSVVPKLTVENKEPAVYQEVLGSGWTRLYRGYIRKKKEEVCPVIEEKTLLAFAMSATKMNEIIMTATEKKQPKTPKPPKPPKKSAIESRESSVASEVAPKTPKISQPSKSVGRSRQSSISSVSSVKVKEEAAGAREEPVDFVAPPESEVVKEKKEKKEKKMEETVEEKEKMEKKREETVEEKEPEQVEKAAVEVMDTSTVEDTAREEDRKKTKERKRKEKTASEEKNTAKRRRSESVTSVQSAVASTSTGITKYTGEPIDITGFSAEKLTQVFGLKKAVIETTLLSREALDTIMMSFRRAPKSEKKQNRASPPPPKKKLRVLSSSPDTSPVRNKEKEEVDIEVAMEANSIAQPSEDLPSADVPVDSPDSPPSSCRGLPPTRSPSPSPPPPKKVSKKKSEDDKDGCDSVDSTIANDMRKQCKPIERNCVRCDRGLHTCVDDWYLNLGADSHYCSIICIDMVVDRVAELVDYDQSKRVTMIGPNDQIRCGNEGPLLSQLAQYIRRSAAWIPALITDKTAEEIEKLELESKQSTVPKKAPKVLSKDSDSVRLSVKKALSEALINRVKRTPGCTFKMKECKDKVEVLEAELFKFCKQNAMSPGYRKWFRSFIGQVKDLKNKGLFIKVLSGDVTPQRIVSCDADLLCSKEFSGVSSESAEVLEDTPPVSYYIPPASAETTAATKEISKHIATAPPVMGRIPKKPRNQQPAGGSTLDALLGDGKQDTTSQHQSHFYDTNCSICASKAKTVAEQEKKDREEKERFREEERIRKERKEKRMAGNRGVKRFEMEPKWNRRDNSPLPMDDGPNFDFRKPLGLRGSPKTAYAGSDDGDYGGGDASPINDSWRKPLDDKGDENTNQNGDDSWLSKPAEESVVKRDDWDRSHVVWRGQITMGSVAFVSSLVAVSNPVAFDMCASADLPPSLRIKGRIKPIVVFEYLSSLRHTESHNVIVMKLERPLDCEGERRFKSVYDDMLYKDRYQVLDFESNGQVKDGYLLALQENCEPPAVLLPFDGPGIPERHPDLILCIMIRYKIGDSWRTEATSEETPANQPSDPATTSAAGESPAAPLNKIISKTALSALSEKVTAILDARETVQPEPQSDRLLPQKFFDLLKKDDEVAQPTQELDLLEGSNIQSLSDLLLFIQLTANPKKMKEVVARYLQHPEFTENDRLVIRKKIMEKVAMMKTKKGKPESAPEEPSFEAPPLGDPAVMAPEAVKTFEEEYNPAQPNEPEDEPAGDNDSTAGTINEPVEDQSRAISPSDFDAENTTSFLAANVDMAGMLSKLSDSAPMPPVFDAEKPESRSSSVNDKLVVSTEEDALPPPPPPPTSDFPPSIPLPKTPPPAEVDLSLIPPPLVPNIAETSNPPLGGIPVLGGATSQFIDISEANSVEAMMGDESPEEEKQEGQSQLFYPAPPPPFMAGMAPPPTGMTQPPPMFGLPPPVHMMGMPPPNVTGPPPMVPPSLAPPSLAPPPLGPPPFGMPPPNIHSSQMEMGMPPPHMMAPPPAANPLEIHGSAGFKGLAPSLGGRVVRNSMIDYFNSASSTSSLPEIMKNDPTAAPLVALPAGIDLSRNSSAGVMPGFGRSRIKLDEVDDNIPRTPTPSPPPSPRRFKPGALRPGALIRPGAMTRPGAAVGKRLIPGARIPQRQPSPDAEEIEMMMREERRRKKQLEREQENERKKIEEEKWKEEREREMSAFNKQQLGKIPRNAPPAVVLCRVRMVAEQERISLEAAEIKVREEHMMRSDDEQSASEDDMGTPMPKRRKRGGKKHRLERLERDRKRRESHFTGFVPIHRQKRALNIEYDDPSAGESNDFGDVYGGGQRRDYDDEDRQLEDCDREEREPVAEERPQEPNIPQETTPQQSKGASGDFSRDVSPPPSLAERPPPPSVPVPEPAAVTEKEPANPSTSNDVDMELCSEGPAGEAADPWKGYDWNGPPQQHQQPQHAPQRNDWDTPRREWNNTPPPQHNNDWEHMDQAGRGPPPFGGRGHEEFRHSFEHERPPMFHNERPHPQQHQQRREDWDEFPTSRGGFDDHYYDRGYELHFQDGYGGPPRPGPHGGFGGRGRGLMHPPRGGPPQFHEREAPQKPRFFGGLPLGHAAPRGRAATRSPGIPIRGGFLGASPSERGGWRGGPPRGGHAPSPQWDPPGPMMATPPHRGGPHLHRGAPPVPRGGPHSFANGPPKPPPMAPGYSMAPHNERRPPSNGSATNNSLIMPPPPPPPPPPPRW